MIFFFLFLTSSVFAQQGPFSLYLLNAVQNFNPGTQAFVDNSLMYSQNTQPPNSIANRFSYLGSAPNGNFGDRFTLSAKGYLGIFGQPSYTAYSSFRNDLTGSEFNNASNFLLLFSQEPTLAAGSDSGKSLPIFSISASGEIITPNNNFYSCIDSTGSPGLLALPFQRNTNTNAACTQIRLTTVKPADMSSSSVVSAPSALPSTSSTSIMSVGGPFTNSSQSSSEAGSSVNDAGISVTDVVVVSVTIAVIVSVNAQGNLVSLTSTNVNTLTTAFDAGASISIGPQTTVLPSVTDISSTVTVSATRTITLTNSAQSIVAETIGLVKHRTGDQISTMIPTTPVEVSTAISAQMTGATSPESDLPIITTAPVVGSNGLRVGFPLIIAIGAISIMALIH